MILISYIILKIKYSDEILGSFDVCCTCSISLIRNFVRIIAIINIIIDLRYKAIYSLSNVFVQIQSVPLLTYIRFWEPNSHIRLSHSLLNLFKVHLILLMQIRINVLHWQNLKMQYWLLSLLIQYVLLK